MCNLKTRGTEAIQNDRHLPVVFALGPEAERFAAALPHAVVREPAQHSDPACAHARNGRASREVDSTGVLQYLASVLSRQLAGNQGHLGCHSPIAGLTLTLGRPVWRAALGSGGRVESGGGAESRRACIQGRTLATFAGARDERSPGNPIPILGAPGFQSQHLRVRRSSSQCLCVVPPSVLGMQHGRLRQHVVRNAALLLALELASQPAAIGEGRTHTPSLGHRKSTMPRRPPQVPVWRHGA